MDTQEQFTANRTKALQWWRSKLTLDQQEQLAKEYFPYYMFAMVAMSSSKVQVIWESENNKYEDTANRLLGISDDWGYNDIKEHLKWLINNPNEIADSYDKSVFKTNNVDMIMDEVQIKLNK